MDSPSFLILGAGPVGCLLAILLRKRGIPVSVIEKRPDWRGKKSYVGRSINLAISSRGITTLIMAGLSEKVLHESVPMQQRAIHDQNGDVFYQPYDISGRAINSISREKLNDVLLQELTDSGVEVFFDTKYEVDWAKSEAYWNQSDGSLKKVRFDLLIGCDGANSFLRNELEAKGVLNVQKQPLGYGYKELTFSKTNSWNENSLHIWPRKSFMMIALPNKDNTYTGTLFLPLEGENSFDSVRENPSSFFEQYFNDSLPYLTDFQQQFELSPVSSLSTVYCDVWYSKPFKALLMGDSAHAIVPFYGQGLNAGLEDVRVFIELLDNIPQYSDELLPMFYHKRKLNADAIAELALQNFVEMRDKVGDTRFRDRKKLEALLGKLFPETWVPQYTMVTFMPEVDYLTALKVGVVQSGILDKIMNDFGNSYPEDSNSYISYIADYKELLAGL